ncbi:hypothetical protein WJ39_20015 [Burkholderia diffusa]|nr:hypothetical protein WJ39_20015 [Burkholderia diffusa]
MNCPSSLSSLVCVALAGIACAVNAQTLPAVPADAPAFASAAVLPSTSLQRPAQAAATSDAADRAAADDAWRGDTLYTSPYAKSPYEQPGEPD